MSTITPTSYSILVAPTNDKLSHILLPNERMCNFSGDVITDATDVFSSNQVLSLTQFSDVTTALISYFKNARVNCLRAAFEGYVYSYSTVCVTSVSIVDLLDTWIGIQIGQGVSIDTVGERFEYLCAMGLFTAPDAIFMDAHNDSYPYIRQASFLNVMDFTDDVLTDLSQFINPSNKISDSYVDDTVSSGNTSTAADEAGHAS